MIPHDIFTAPLSLKHGIARECFEKKNRNFSRINNTNTSSVFYRERDKNNTLPNYYLIPSSFAYFSVLSRNLVSFSSIDLVVGRRHRRISLYRLV